jgi:hypothetical protein
VEGSDDFVFPFSSFHLFQINQPMVFSSNVTIKALMAVASDKEQK